MQLGLVASSLALLALFGSGLERAELDDATIARCRAHYAQVESELRARDVSTLSAAQQSERTRLIDALHAYNQRGQFGRNFVVPLARIPQFVDRGGRRCAVAELLHVSGRDDLVETVELAQNDAWVLDLRTDPDFNAWLDANGLDVFEAARIQVPGGGIGGGGQYDQGHTSGSTPAKKKPTYNGPGDTTPHGGSGAPVSGGSGEPTKPPGTPAPVGPTIPNAPNSPFSPATFAAEAASDATWMAWWEYNKLAYLHASPFSIKLGLRTGVESPREKQSMVEQQLDTMRAAYFATLVHGLDHGEAQVRGDAAVALGRMNGKDAVPVLTKCLADPSASVRNRALLALGATGSEDAYEVLSRVAETGTLRDGQSVSVQARPMAILGLAIGRRSGFDDRADREVGRIVRGRGKGDGDRIALAGLMYESIASCAELDKLALEIAQDKSVSTGVRCRAIEDLTASPTDDVLSKMQHWLSGSELELRRSAAIALGAFKHPLVLPPLMTAYELEIEPVTRGFLLISIGEQGGDTARDFLLRALSKGDSNARPWAALGLGVLAHGGDDDVVRDALRAAFAAEKNHDNAPAYWIALGLARDLRAVDPLSEAFLHVSDPWQRSYIATSLALIGDDRARAALLARSNVETSPVVRVAIAQSLGYLGKPKDAPILLDTLKSLREPDLEALLAVGLGFHGTSEALTGLSTLLADPATTAPARAASFDGLGILLGRHAPFELSLASRNSNYTVYEDWLDEVFGVTL